jgi:DNA-binding NarL/FixJ family response regulator
MAPASLTAVIADDDPLVRRVLRNGLDQGGLTIVAEAGTFREALHSTIHHRPHLLVLDLVMPDGDILDILRRVEESAPGTVVVVLTSATDDEAALTVLAAGASGFLTKDTGLDGLPRALVSAVDGEAAISRRLTRVLVERLRALPEGRMGLRPVSSPLTAREWEVLDLLSTGCGTEDIAATLVVSTETVRSHIKGILRKLGVNSRAEAVLAAASQRAKAAG